VKYIAYPYQEYITQRITSGTAGIFADMGLGKSVATLTAIDRLIYDLHEVKKVLVIAPLRIADEVWSSEIEKWDHLKRLKLVKVLGSERQRKEALRQKADIYIINRENVPWLVAFLASGFNFDMLVIDESSSFKNPSSKRFRALRRVRPLAKRVYILTGTPIPNGLLGLWAQVYLLDRGERLGESFSHYRKEYFDPDKRNREMVYSYKLKTPGKAEASILGDDIFEKEIHDRIGDICFSMKSEDYLQLPPRIDRVRTITLDPGTYKRYQDFERDKVLGIAGDREITALNAGALTTKMLQFANGAVYDQDKNYHVVHEYKLNALEEIIEAADGKPVIVFYTFQHDLTRVRQRFPDLRVLKTSQDIRDWNDGTVEVMAAHPASAGHGLNLQAGGNIVVWFGIPFDLELFQQANKRLHRMGQTKPVIIHLLVVKGTMDEDALDALNGKSTMQEAMIRAVKVRIDKYQPGKKVA
jgi:SNF2 family DNA or RNA helicase